jgi:hypothetical protein
MKTAYVTIKGFELMRTVKKGQLDMWKSGRGLTGEIRLIESEFGIYAHNQSNQGQRSGLSFFCKEHAYVVNLHIGRSSLLNDLYCIPLLGQFDAI